MLSSNAPFNEFGQSMILRDIEQLYLSLNNAGRGSAGDGGTQDQATVADQNTGDSGGLPDLSGLATTDYVDAAIASIGTVTTVHAYATDNMGGTGPSTEYPSFTLVSGSGVSGDSFIAPKDGVFVVSAKASSTVSLSGAPTAVQETLSVSLTAPYGSTFGTGFVDFPNITATGLAWYASNYQMQANAIWCGYLAAGESITVSVTSRIAVTNTNVYLHVCGVCP